MAVVLGSLLEATAQSSLQRRDLRLGFHHKLHISHMVSNAC